MTALLKVLDMSEDEQRKWVLLNVCKERMPRVSLADLAFRLRDEAREIKKVQEDMILPIAWLRACYMVIHRKEVDCYARVLDAEEAEYEVLKRKPIVWIIAALIAKEIQDA